MIVLGNGPLDPEDENRGPALYDCRNRVWYVMASTSPKDVVFMIDMSGSMIGSNIGEDLTDEHICVSNMTLLTSYYACSLNTVSSLWKK